MRVNDLNELKRSFSADRLIALAESEGLKRKGRKLQCPKRCTDKSGSIISVSVGENDGVSVWKCHRDACSAGGSVVDFVMALQNCTDGAAISWLRQNSGSFATAPKQPKAPAPPVGPFWEGLPTEDRAGVEYLESRGLLGAVALGLVRFNVGRTTYPWLNFRASEGFRVAVPMFNVSGALVRMQLRSVLPGGREGTTKLSTPGSYPPGGVAIGGVAEAKTAARVYLAEGIADTLALQLAGVVTIGAPGTSELAKLFNFLGEVKGRQFVLCRQNDSGGQNHRALSPLQVQLQQAGAIILTLTPPAPHKDPAEWLQAVGLETFKRMVTTGLPTAAPEADPGTEPADNVLQLAPAAGDAEFSKSLETSGLKKFGKTYASLVHIIRHDRRIVAEPLVFNEMLCGPTLCGRALEDHDTARFRELLELHSTDDDGDALEFGSADIEQAVIQVSNERTCHPVRDYLNSLTWDGIERIDSVAEEILGADRTEMTQKMVRRWFIGAARRPLEPGCKFDTVLVLVGPQGHMKSSFFSTLAGRREWFSDDHVDIDNRDSTMLLQAVWILEWGELVTMQRAKDLESLKAFIAKRDNKFRLPYGRRIIERPRHSVIVGSTNRPEFLSDPTGNRRFWPVTIGGSIDLKKLAEWRDQLWAEAVAAVKAGERTWFDEEENEQLGIAQKPHEETHPWSERIRDWLDSENPGRANPCLVTAANVLEHAIKKPAGQWTKPDEMTVATVLKQLGWARTSRTFDGSGRQVRIWSRATTGQAQRPAHGAAG